MKARDAILSLLVRAADALGDDLSEVVFVGGAAVALFGRPEKLRPTVDVDVISPASRPEYHRLIARLSARGFRPARGEDDPVCRYVYEDQAGPLVVDVMPVDPRVLGFANAWYEDAASDAMTVRLPSGKAVNVIRPIYFVATKLEAFGSRGGRDFQASHDLEDLLGVLAEHPDVRRGIESGATRVELHVRRQLIELAGIDDFMDVIGFHFDHSDQALARTVYEWLRSLK